LVEERTFNFDMEVFFPPSHTFGATSLGRISKGIYPNIRIIHMVGIIGH
jgi:hypothetical protein